MRKGKREDYPEKKVSETTKTAREGGGVGGKRVLTGKRSRKKGEKDKKKQRKKVTE